MKLDMELEDILVKDVDDCSLDVESSEAQVYELLSDGVRHVAPGLAMCMMMIPLMSSFVRADSIVADPEIPKLHLEFSLSETVRISWFESSESRKRLLASLERLRQVDNGWNGENSLKPTDAALNQAEVIICSLDERILKSCAIFPSSDSGVYLQGRLPKGRITVYMNGDTMTYVVKSSSSDKLSATLPSTYDNINYLNIGALMYV